MQLKHWLLISLTSFVLNVSIGQTSPAISQYIEQYKGIAIEEMKQYKIPASITIAQGIHESNCGRSPLAKEARNHFGIKCHKEWTGKTYRYDDDKKDECFRVYNHAEESYRDHSEFLSSRDRYNNLFELNLKDYKGWAHGLKKDGYATNPRYPEIIIKLIENNQLYKYDDPSLINSDAVVVRKAEEKKPIKEPKSNPVIPQKAAIESSEFQVNGIKAIKATGKENLYELARQNDLSISRLMEINDLGEGDKFKAGENILFQTKKNRGEQSTYTLQRGESMRDVSQRFGIKLHKLYQRNLMEPNDQPETGAVVFLNDHRESPPPHVSYETFLAKNRAADEQALVIVSTQNKANETIVPTGERNPKPIYTYEVSPKETLYSISKKLNVSLADLRQLNHLASDTIKPGQTLIVSK